MERKDLCIVHMNKTEDNKIISFFVNRKEQGFAIEVFDGTEKPKTIFLTQDEALALGLNLIEMVKINLKNNGV